MNERIIELLIEAREVTKEGNWKPPTHVWADKFAELIIKECSKVIINGGYWNPAFGEKHPLTPPEIAKMIEEHFGVE